MNPDRSAFDGVICRHNRPFVPINEYGANRLLPLSRAKKFLAESVQCSGRNRVMHWREGILAYLAAAFNHREAPGMPPVGVVPAPRSKECTDMLFSDQDDSGLSPVAVMLRYRRTGPRLASELNRSRGSQVVRPVG